MTLFEIAFLRTLNRFHAGNCLETLLALSAGDDALTARGVRAAVEAINGWPDPVRLECRALGLPRDTHERLFALAQIPDRRALWADDSYCAAMAASD